MSNVVVNQTQLEVQNLNNDGCQELQEIEEVKHDPDNYLKCGEINYFNLDQSLVYSSFKENFANASLS